MLDSKGNVRRFHPLLKVDEQWENWFIKKHNIQLCKLYTEPYNFKRTGCRFCPFSLDLEHQLEVAQRLLPNDYKAGNVIWGKVFNEYRRIGFRLKNIEQIKLF